MKSYHIQAISKASANSHVRTSSLFPRTWSCFSTKQRCESDVANASRSWLCCQKKKKKNLIESMNEVCILMSCYLSFSGVEFMSRNMAGSTEQWEKFEDIQCVNWFRRTPVSGKEIRKTILKRFLLHELQ